MGWIACPNCGATDRQAYDAHSTWCEPCVVATLAEQERLDTPVQEPEVIDTLRRV